MKQLYPLKFKPILKDKIWGGKRLKTRLNKTSASEAAGESWEISGLEGDVSVVANGFLKGNNIQELIEVYMGDLLGDSVYEKFGNNFPLLVKYIDANDILSIQVHPGDDYALEHHNSFGKTEMWYIIDSDNGAELISGFNKNTSREEYLEYLQNGRLPELLNYIKTNPGDVFFMPAGRVHAIGAGNLLAEIQQSSDLTYRIYDWGRVDENGKARELHIEHALEVIDFNRTLQAKTPYDKSLNKSNVLASCAYFRTNRMEFDRIVEKDYNLIDSFIIYMCTSGSALLLYNGTNSLKIEKGETVLIPAELKNLSIMPQSLTTLLEIYIPQ